MTTNQNEPWRVTQPGEEKRGPWVAVYSVSAVLAGHSTSFYERHGGGEVECSAVYLPGEEGSYRWPDAENRGMVERRLRSGAPDRTGFARARPRPLGE